VDTAGGLLFFGQSSAVSAYSFLTLPVTLTYYTHVGSVSE